ncbi:Cyclin-G-associated kinase [Aphelenchoides fujianensis]|nr:Cyclin-G-associated kinase [Aphelenchoides fujianensis]
MTDGRASHPVRSIGRPKMADIQQNVTNLFKSALNFISSQGIPGVTRAAGTAAGGQDHPLVGSTVEVGKHRVKIHSLLAEGGFALVFACQNQEGRWLALKRQIPTDADSANAIIQEINFAKELSGHPAIMTYVAAAQSKANNRTEFFLLTELLSGGPLIDHMQRAKLRPDQVLKIFYALCTAVHHMHDRNPPITHRDLKIENLLFDSKGHIKLCDFGSATTDIFRPDETWSVSQRSRLEEDMQKFTTPMYRSPEVLDLYQNYPIGPSQDIWALGCILVYLCYGRHPFEDSAKLAIVNANYRLPKEETPFSVFHSIIESLLQPDPYSRPMISDVCERLEAVAVVFGVDPRAPVTGLGLPFEQSDPEVQRPVNRTPPPVPPAAAVGGVPTAKAAAHSAPPRPPPPRAAHSPPVGSASRPEVGGSQGGFPLDEEERIRVFEERENRRADEAHRQALAEEAEYRRRLAAENQALREAEDRRKREAAQPPRPPPPADDDPFAIFDTRPQASTSSANLRPSAVDLLGDWPTDSSGGIQRNSSAPSLDPFADFLASTADNPPKPPPRNSSTTAGASAAARSAGNSGRSTPAQRPKPPAQQQTAGVNFESFFNSNGTGVGPKFDESAFDDILSSQGFSSTAKNAQRSLADMKRAELARELSPTEMKAIQIRDWTEGKEKNIRALLSSLNEVLWEGANYTPPTVVDLMPDENVKKFYRRALIVIHPDKHRDEPHEELAKCVFSCLDLAWKKFEEERS